MSKFIRAMLVPATLLTVLAVSGCAAYDDEYGPPGVVIDRGYYFDPDYYDTYGYYHPRSYWYYDGNAYVHRDAMPRGQIAHLRAHVFHGGPIGHDSFHADRPTAGGDHGGGGDFSHGGQAGGGFAGGHGR